MPAKLVTIGDSLTQGFQSGAIVKTEWSWPKMVSRALGIPAPNFRAPDFFSGPGGPMVDLERLMRKVSEFTKETIDWWEVPGAALTSVQFLAEVEDYWERKDGTKPTNTGPLHHNLGVWGFEYGDCDTLTDGVCRRNMPKAKDENWFQNQVPEFAMYRTALRTLNPAQQIELEELSQVAAARQLAKDEGGGEGGIENLVVCLGANNVLGTCLSLSLRWSQSAEIRKLAHQRTANIWDPEHFEKLLDRVYPQLKEMQVEGLAKNVFLGTVPHVTVAPVTRGVSPNAPGSTPGAERPERDADGYYEYYTNFWVWDDEFKKDPDAYPKLTREDAKLIDGTIDDYNEAIRARAKANDWQVIELGAMLDSLAYRRSGGKPTFRFPQKLVDALAANPATKFRVFPDGPDGRQRLLLDTRYMNVTSDQANPSDFDAMSTKYRGGLFSLDGVHPTTVGYGLLAHKVLETMKGAGVPGADPDSLDWNAIVSNDTLLTKPPVLLNNLQQTLGFFTSRAPLPALIQKLAGYGAEP